MIIHSLISPHVKLCRDPNHHPNYPFPRTNHQIIDHPFMMSYLWQRPDHHNRHPDLMIQPNPVLQNKHFFCLLLLRTVSIHSRLVCHAYPRKWWWRSDPMDVIHHFPFSFVLPDSPDHAHRIMMITDEWKIPLLFHCLDHDDPIALAVPTCCETMIQERNVRTDGWICMHD